MSSANSKLKTRRFGKFKYRLKRSYRATQVGRNSDEEHTHSVFICPAMTARMDLELARLPDMPLSELRSLWTKLTESHAPKISPALLRLALAWEMQANAHGGLSRVTQQRLAQLDRGLTQTALVAPGMRLIREWNGVAHVVTVAADGAIRWNDQEWNSLSEVARTITGTRWSGPAFFGLKRKAAA